MSKRFMMAAVLTMGWITAVSGREDPGPEDYVWAQQFSLPPAPRIATFDPADNQANFTFFDGVENVRVEDGVLKFTMTTNKATLGWGNYLGRQSPEEMVETPEGWTPAANGGVVFTVKQSVPETEWSLRGWRAGRRHGDAIKQSLEGEDPSELKFNLRDGFGSGTTPLAREQHPDGLEIEITGDSGAEIELHEVQAVAMHHEGYFRKTLELPDSTVWQALAQVSGWAGLYINGELVHDRRGVHMAHGMQILDIAPFLKPGRNVIAAHGTRNHSGWFLLQCRIGMQSGEIISIATDNTWMFTNAVPEGWLGADFDDSSWTTPRTHKPVYLRNYLTTFVPHHEHGALTRLRNPARKELFYGDKDEVIVDVLAPAGLKGRTPEVDYVFASTDADGKSIPVKTGTIKTFSADGDDLLFRADVGRHPSGVYTFAATLKDKDGVLEERLREPLMILQTVETPTVAGEDYSDGLDMELETVYDFTNPKDPHPWIAARPGGRGNPWEADTEFRVVTTNGLTYRITHFDDAARYKRDYFAYRIEFEHPGSWYLLELDYPDDADRHAIVTINNTRMSLDTIARGNQSLSKSGVGYETGGKYYKTGKMQTLRWLHVASSGPQVLYVANFDGVAPAAAAGLRVYRIEGGLPSIGGGMNRQFGVLTERCTDSSGFASNFGPDRPDRPQGPEATARWTVLEYRILYLRYMQETVENYVEYLRFTGQNTYIMGMFQYSEGNTAYMKPYTWDTAALLPEMRNVTANVLDYNNVNLYLNFQFCTFDSISTTATDAEVARGADTVWRVNEFGEQKTSGTQVGSLLQNWMHPLVRERYYDVIRDYIEKFGHLKAFKGIRVPLNIATGLWGYYMPGLTEDTRYQDPFMWSYDDATFARFEKDTGINLHIAADDPQRFQKRALAIKNPEVRRRYTTWRCEAFRDFMAESLAVMREVKPEAVFIMDFVSEHDDLWRYWLSTGREFGDWVRDYAVDIKLLDATPGLVVGRWTHALNYHRVIRGYLSDIEDPYKFLVKTEPRIYEEFGTGPLRHMQVRVSWDESNAVTGGETPKYGSGMEVVRDDWIPNFVILRALPQLSGYNCREGLIQAIITGDPNSLMHGYTDLNLNVGYEQEIRTMMKPYTHLPPERFAPVLDTGLESNFAIRRLVKDGETWLYVANPGYWNIEGSITLATTAEITDLASGKPAAPEKKNGKSILPVVLTPYGLAAWRIDAENVVVESYETGAITDRELEHMQIMYDRVRQLTEDPEIRMVLTGDDAEFMRSSLNTIGRSLETRQYARAWAALTHWRFWLLWKQFLEPAEQILARLPADQDKDPIGMRVLVAAPAETSVTVDGIPDEEIWKNVTWSSGFTTRDRLPGMAETGIKALYDDDNLYLAFICADRDVKAVKGSASWSFSGFDALVVFLQPDENESVYYQLGLNTGAGRFHQKVFGGERIYEVLPWTAKTAASEGYWTAEAVFPFKMFGMKDRGTGAWRINIHRIMRDQLADNSSWHFEPGNWHYPDFGNRQPFGRLTFQ